MDITTWITTWIAAHGTLLAYMFGGYLAFSALVGSMPPLKDNASYLARWAYGFLHLFAMNIAEASKLLPIKLPEFLRKEVVEREGQNKHDCTLSGPDNKSTTKEVD